MNKRFLSLLFFLILVAFLAWIVLSFFDSSQKPMQQAYDAYVKGETATTVAQRQDSFNEALTLYTSLEKTYHPTYGNGKLNYNIGNSYFQLGQIPLALLHYYRAQNLRPHDSTLEHNIAIAQKKIDAPQRPTPSIWQRYFLLNHIISLPHRIQIFFFLSLFTFAFSSLAIWLNNPWSSRLSVTLGIATTIVLINLFFTQYFTPLQGILITPSVLYRDAGKQYAQAYNDPLPAGLSVDINTIVQEGTWIKVTTSGGKTGYVPQETLRVI